VLVRVDSADGPMDEELVEIEAERPLIEAELRVVNAEVALAQIDDLGSELGQRRWRRAEAAKAAALREVCALVSLGMPGHVGDAA